MEIAATAFTAITSAISSVVGAGASAAGSVAGAASTAGSLFSSGGSLLSTLLQGGLGVMGAMSAMQQGKTESAALQQQAQQAEFDATQQRLAGEQKSDELRRQLLAESGARDVAYAASGFDPTFGTPAMARDQAADDTARALNVESANADIAASRYRMRAAGYQAQAAAAKSAGFYKALGVAGTTAVSILRRG